MDFVFYSHIKPIFLRLSKDFFLIVLFLCTSCAGFFGEDDQQTNLVERSKAGPPSWTQQKPGFLFESESFLNFYACHDNINNLTDGLKKAQTEIFQDTKEALNIHARQFLLRNLDDKRPANIEQDLDRLVFDAVQSYQVKHAKVADIYFERYSKGNIGHSESEEDMFKIYILIQFPKEEFSELMDEISKKLVASNDTTLNGLGAFLKNRVH